jgi:hypothetical protein
LIDITTISLSFTNRDGDGLRSSLADDVIDDMRRCSEYSSELISKTKDVISITRDMVSIVLPFHASLSVHATEIYTGSLTGQTLRSDILDDGTGSQVEGVPFPSSSDHIHDVVVDGIDLSVEYLEIGGRTAKGIDDAAVVHLRTDGSVGEGFTVGLNPVGRVDVDSSDIDVASELGFDGVTKGLTEHLLDVATESLAGGGELPGWDGHDCAFVCAERRLRAGVVLTVDKRNKLTL